MALPAVALVVLVASAGPLVKAGFLIAASACYLTGSLRLRKELPPRRPRDSN
jgi:hypothetical protein